MHKNIKSILHQISSEVYDPCNLKISEFEIDTESKEYSACHFKLNAQKIISRNSKITPRKVGQFVTFWKRNKNGIIEPFEETDPFDLYAVNVKTEKEFGQFVFPKSVLVEKGIISTTKKEGKRGFRVYPSWDIPNNPQAEKTQKWQVDYFYKINETTNFKRVTELYNTK